MNRTPLNLKGPPTGNLPKLQRPAKRHEPMRQSLQMDDYFIPRSEILNNPSQHSQQSIETERRRVVRMSMDSLIGQNGGRPSEAELQSLARLMASHYPSLRDKPLKGLRDIYVSKLNLKNNFLIFNNHSNIYSKKKYCYLIYLLLSF